MTWIDAAILAALVLAACIIVRDIGYRVRAARWQRIRHVRGQPSEPETHGDDGGRPTWREENGL